MTTGISRRSDRKTESFLINILVITEGNTRFVCLKVKQAAKENVGYFVPLRRTSASASRSAPIWPPAAMTPEPLPDRSPGSRPAATITKPSAPMQSPSAYSRSQTTRACARPASRKTTTRPIERTEKAIDLSLRGAKRRGNLAVHSRIVGQQLGILEGL